MDVICNGNHFSGWEYSSEENGIFGVMNHQKRNKNGRWPPLKQNYSIRSIHKEAYPATCSNLMLTHHLQ